MLEMRTWGDGRPTSEMRTLGLERLSSCLGSPDSEGAAGVCAGPCGLEADTVHLQAVVVSSPWLPLLPEKNRDALAQAALRVLFRSSLSQVPSTARRVCLWGEADPRRFSRKAPGAWGRGSSGRHGVVEPIRRRPEGGLEHRAQLNAACRQGSP